MPKSYIHHASFRTASQANVLTQRQTCCKIWFPLKNWCTHLWSSDWSGIEPLLTLVKLCSVPADVFYLQHLIGTVQERKSKNLYPRVFFPLVLPLMLCGTVLLLQAKKIIWKWHKMWNKNCTSEVKQKRSNKLFRKQRWKFHLNYGIN